MYFWEFFLSDFGDSPTSVDSSPGIWGIFLLGFWEFSSWDFRDLSPGILGILLSFPCGLISRFFGILPFFCGFLSPSTSHLQGKFPGWVNQERFPLWEKNSRRENPPFPGPFPGIIPRDHPQVLTLPFLVPSGPSQISGGSIDPWIDPGSIPAGSSPSLGVGSAIPGKNPP